MKKNFIYAALGILLMACNEKPSYEISGTVSNADLNGKYVYLYEDGKPNALPFDSAIVSNNTFSFKGTQDGSILATIRFSTDIIPINRKESTPFSTTFTLENGKIAIALDTISAVTGTPANNAEKELSDLLDSIFADMEKLDDAIQSEDKAIAKAAEDKYDELDKKVTDAVCNYILAHLDQKMPAKYFYNYQYQISEEKQNEILSKAGSTFKSVPGVAKIIERLNVLQKVAVGNKFTDFEMADASGKMHKLSEFIGNGKNIVLIDFWASWCPPCRKEMPNLVEAYKQYKNKGFEIVGISLDNDANAWAKGVKDLGITWAQLSDLQGWKNTGAALYGVNMIPHTVLIDKDGTIIAKNLYGDELEAKLKEVLE